MIGVWFWDWRLRHLERIPRDDWPEAGSPFWENFQTQFVRLGVRSEVAEEASKLLALDPPRFLDRQLAGIVAKIEGVWKTSEVAPAASTREEAERLSRECDDCGGKTGLATRYRHQSLTPGRPPTVQFYCLCSLGRWVEKAHREGGEEAREVRRRIPDLADYPWLHGPEFRQPPGIEPYQTEYRDVAALRARLNRDLASRADRSLSRRPTIAPAKLPHGLEDLRTQTVTQVPPASPEDIADVSRQLGRAVPRTPPASPPPTTPEPTRSRTIEPGDPDWPPF